MGYKRSRWGTKSYWPDNSKNTLYLVAGHTLGEMLEKAREHWGEHIDIDEIEVDAQKVYYRRIGHPEPHDSDYNGFCVLRYPKTSG